MLVDLKGLGRHGGNYPLLHGRCLCWVYIPQGSTIARMCVPCVSLMACSMVEARKRVELHGMGRPRFNFTVIAAGDFGTLLGGALNVKVNY